MRPRRTIRILLLAGATVALPLGAAGQEGAAPAVPTELTSLEGRPGPTGAMVRSLVLPGWGQASYDRYFRGGVYFVGHGGNLFMIFRTLAKLDEARDREDRWVAFVRAREIAAGTPPDSIDAAIDADPDVAHVRDLVASREAQREDWLALGAFWVLVSGLDAFVTAQLADFPASIGAGTDGRRWGITVSVPVR